MPLRYFLGLLLVLFAAAAVPADKHLLWKVSPDAGATAYLLGSVHYGKPELYPLDAVILDAFEAADVLAVEADVLNADLVSLASDYASKGLYTEGGTLEDHLEPATWRALTRTAERYGIPVQLLQPQKPWAVALLLSSLEFQRAGYREDLGVDLHFLQKAQGQKPIVELESLAGQLAMLAGFSPQEQEAFLRITLQELEQGAEKLQAVISAWERGDAGAIDRLLNESFQNSPEAERIYQILLTDRNAAMADKIEALMRRGKTLFVVVGAGHLVGDDGIVELLKARGYQVEQL